MGKLGRCRITVSGREFVWWMHDEAESIRVASADKRFVVGYELACRIRARPMLKVSGAEFPGIHPGEPRPIWLVPPEFDHWYSWKGLARRIIEWSLAPDHVIVRAVR